MATWQRFETEQSELAGRVREVFEASASHVLATLRRNGAPRVSGIDIAFDGADLTFGSMPLAMKALDLQRDGRFALHATPRDGGDAKVSGIAIERTTPDQVAGGASHHFRADIEEVVFTSLSDDGERLLVRWWRPGQPVQKFLRDS